MLAERFICFAHMNPEPSAEDDQARMALLSPRSRIHLWLLRESGPIPGWETISELSLGGGTDNSMRDDEVSMCKSEGGRIHWSDSSSPRDKYTQTDMPVLKEMAVQCELMFQPMTEEESLEPAMGSMAGEQAPPGTRMQPAAVEEMGQAMTEGEDPAETFVSMQGEAYHFPEIGDDFVAEEWNTMGITVTAAARGNQRPIRLSGPITWDGRAGL